MLKFKNREGATGKEFEYRISMTSVQGGVEVEVDEEQVVPDRFPMRRRTLLMTPMDAAAFVNDTRVSQGLHCRQVGHCITNDGSTGLTLHITKLARANVTGMEFIGDCAEVGLSICGVDMVVPTFVIDAMRLCVERMFETLMFPSTGDMEEEFG